MPGAQARKMRDDVKHVKIIVLGDTFSAGYQIEQEDTYARKLRTRLNEKFFGARIDVVNMSREGLTAAGAVSFLPTILAHKPQMVIVALGGDDGLLGIDPAITSRALEQIISVLTHNNIYTMIVGFKSSENENLQYAMRYDAQFVALAKRYRLTFIPDLMAGIREDPFKRLFDSPYPNEDGMDIIAQTLYRYTQKMVGPFIR